MIEVSNGKFYVPYLRLEQFYTEVKKLFPDVADPLKGAPIGMQTFGLWGPKMPILEGLWYKTSEEGALTTESIEDVAKVGSLLSQSARNIVMNAGKKMQRDAWTDALLPQIKIEDYIPAGLGLDKHQIETAVYSLTGDNTVCADDAGTGKTVSNIVVANMLAAYRVLVICPSSAKYNWKKHFGEWSTTGITDDKCFVVEGRDVYDTKKLRGLIDAKHGVRVDIINFDILAAHKSWINGVQYDLMIVDETHRLQNEGTLRTASILGGVVKDKNGGPAQSFHSIKAFKKIFSTGTWADRPIQTWPIVRALLPHTLGASYEKFIVRYCNAFKDPHTLQWDTRGASNLVELRQTLRAELMVRHTDQVLNLPPMTEETFLINPPGTFVAAESELIRKIVAKLTGKEEPVLSAAEMQQWRTTIGECMLDQTSKVNGVSVPMEEMSALRKATALAKVDPVLAYMKDFQAQYPGEPVVVFAWHKDMVKALAKGLSKKYRVGVITGDVKAQDKYNITQQLQNGEIDAIVANMSAAGEALTMTRSRFIIFAEWEWSAKTMWQVLKRVLRRGQLRNVHSVYLIMDRTIEGNLVKSARRKFKTMRALFADETELAALSEPLITTEDATCQSRSDADTNYAQS